MCIYKFTKIRRIFEEFPQHVCRMDVNLRLKNSSQRLYFIETRVAGILNDSDLLMIYQYVEQNNGVYVMNQIAK